MDFFPLLPIECIVGIVRYLSIPEALDFTSTCHFLHDNEPYDIPLGKVLVRVSTVQRSVNFGSDLFSVMLKERAIDELSRLFLSQINDSTIYDLLNSQDGIFTSELESLVGPTFDLLGFFTSFCEYQVLLWGMGVIRSFARNIITHMLRHGHPFDENLYYRLCHVRWHKRETYDDTYVSKKVTDLERFIHLAILTGNANVYKRLVLRRRHCATLSSRFVFSDIQDYKLRVTDQDICTVIRYKSSNIYRMLGLQETPGLKSLMSICKFKNNSHKLTCGLCNPRLTISEQCRKRQNHLDMMKSLLV